VGTGDKGDQVSEETVTCARCGSEIAIADREFSGWEVLAGDKWSCEGCFTDAEVTAADADATETADQARCIRCGRDSSSDGVTAEELNKWVTPGDGSCICAGCAPYEDRLVEYNSAIAGLDQLGAILRDKAGHSGGTDATP
jgi:DNA-directed RNA polymerase subunit RPC12/RpoP